MSHTPDTLKQYHQSSQSRYLYKMKYRFCVPILLQLASLAQAKSGYKPNQSDSVIDLLQDDGKPIEGVTISLVKGTRGHIGQGDVPDKDWVVGTLDMKDPDIVMWYKADGYKKDQGSVLRLVPGERDFTIQATSGKKDIALVSDKTSVIYCHWDRERVFGITN